jgi:hypothetical protein
MIRVYVSDHHVNVLHDVHGHDRHENDRGCYDHDLHDCDHDHDRGGGHVNDHDDGLHGHVSDHVTFWL